MCVGLIVYHFYARDLASYSTY